MIYVSFVSYMGTHRSIPDIYETHPFFISVRTRRITGDLLRLRLPVATVSWRVRT